MTYSHHVGPQQLQAMIHDGAELALLDVREAGEFGESHLLFATPLPYSRLEVDVVTLVPRRSARIVVCDDGDSGVAALARKRLQAIGYSDVSILEGGTRAWAAAGYTLFAGVNVPSKLFGELVEHEYHTPRVTVDELVRMREANEDFVIVDGRPFPEYHKMNIPGGICCPNAELPYRISEIVRNPHTRIIVNCAGRTRSILGAQTLVNFGVPNEVYALENGTQGWVLADLELERGASRRYPESVSESSLPRLRAQASELMKRHSVPSVTGSQAQAWLADPERTTYLIDVRTPEEFAAGSLPGAVHAPGGQLVQATDQWVGVRNARIVLVDSEGVRAPVVASWLKQLGCDVYVLEGGITADLSTTAAQAASLPPLPTTSAAEVHAKLDASACVVIDLRPSSDFREAHIPGSRWSIRSKIVSAAEHASNDIVLVSADEAIASLAAIDLRESGHARVSVLDGGLESWTAEGYETEATPAQPPDSECIDYLFFVHDRHAGNRAAMRQYLAWETGLMGQLNDQDRQLFRVGAH